jgi:hypothetical protein
LPKLVSHHKPLAEGPALLSDLQSIKTTHRPHNYLKVILQQEKK